MLCCSVLTLSTLSSTARFKNYIYIYLFIRIIYPQGDGPMKE